MGCTAIQKEQLDANRCWQIPDQHLHSFLCSFTPKEPKSTQMPAAARFPSSPGKRPLILPLTHVITEPLICTSFLVQPHSFPALTATYPSQVIPQEPSSLPRWVPLLTVSWPFQPGIGVPPTWRKEAGHGRPCVPVMTRLFFWCPKLRKEHPGLKQIPLRWNDGWLNATRRCAF